MQLYIILQGKLIGAHLRTKHHLEGYSRQIDTRNNQEKMTMTVLLDNTNILKQIKGMPSRYGSLD